MPFHPVRLAATFGVLLGPVALQSCASAPGSKPAEVAPVSEPPAADPPPAFQASAPNEIVSEGTSANRRTVVGDMVRLGMVEAVQQGPPGVLRTAVGKTFHSSTNREISYPKLASAYYTWVVEGAPLVIELWERGKKIGEYSDGAFLIGPSYSTPRDCAGPGPAGICASPGYERPVPAAPTSAAAAQDSATGLELPRGHRGLRFGLGLGGGSAGLSCSGCDFPQETALSGYLSFGASIGDNTLVGIEGTGWTDAAEAGSTAQVYSVMAVLTAYANERFPLYVSGGVGLVGYRQDATAGDVAASGLGFSGRVGYELGSGRLALVPYVGYVRSFGHPAFTLNDVDVGEVAISNLQFGLGLRIR